MSKFVSLFQKMAKL